MIFTIIGDKGRKRKTGGEERERRRVGGERSGKRVMYSIIFIIYFGTTHQ
jgi:hypothetical protein